MRKAKPHEHEGLKPLLNLLEMNKNDWYELDKPFFNKLFKFSPLKRTRFSGLKRNFDFLKEK